MSSKIICGCQFLHNSRKEFVNFKAIRDSPEIARFKYWIIPCQSVILSNLLDELFTECTQFFVCQGKQLACSVLHVRIP